MLVEGSDPQPFPVCHKLLSSTRSSAAWPGTAGEVGGCFQLHLCLGKIPFHVAACDLSRRLCRRGRPAGSGGGCCRGGTLTPCTRQTAAPQNLEGMERILLEGEGKESLASRGHQAGGPCMSPPGCWQHKSCRWPRPALRCGVDGSCASPKGEGGAVTQPVCTA